MEIIALNKVPTFDHIIHNIYLSDIVAATNKDCLKNIDIIINISNSRYKEEPNIIYHLETTRLVVETTEIQKAAIHRTRDNVQVVPSCFNFRYVRSHTVV